MRPTRQALDMSEEKPDAEAVELLARWQKGDQAEGGRASRIRTLFNVVLY
jgi:hypothetical protein